MTASFSGLSHLYQIIAKMALHLGFTVLFSVDERITHRRSPAPLFGHSSGPGGRHVLSNPVDRPARLMTSACAPYYESGGYYRSDYYSTDRYVSPGYYRYDRYYVTPQPRYYYQPAPRYYHRSRLRRNTGRIRSRGCSSGTATRAMTTATASARTTGRIGTGMIIVTAASATSMATGTPMGSAMTADAGTADVVKGAGVTGSGR